MSDAGAPADAVLPIAPPVDGIDLLFVIDDSRGTLELQQSLRAAFPGFINALTMRAGGELPSLHIGVVSTAGGAGSGIFGCGEPADAGLLGNSRAIRDCKPPPNRYLEVTSTGNNFEGDLTAAFECIALLGEGGCGFEQPLVAALAAIDGRRELNAGFLRPESLLVVVIVTNEDDCSGTPDTDLFQTWENAHLGPVTSFRCFEQGVRCDEEQLRSRGDKTNCVPREDSTRMVNVVDIAAEIRALRPPDRLVLATIVPPPGPVNVTTVAGMFEVSHVCNSSFGGNADPGIRLHAFTETFGSNAVTGSVCESFDEPLAALAELVGSKL